MHGNGHFFSSSQKLNYKNICKKKSEKNPIEQLLRQINDVKKYETHFRIMHTFCAVFLADFFVAICS